MKRIKKILVPTDLSEHSRRALSYGCGLAEDEKASLIILHVASDLDAWELHSEDLAFIGSGHKVWPLDRVLAEAGLDLTRFLEPSMQSLKSIPIATKRVVLGPVPQQITAIADEENVDLIIMSPRRQRGLRHWLNGGITDRVTRLSPCPVLSVTGPLPTKSWRGKSVRWFSARPRQMADPLLGTRPVNSASAMEIHESSVEITSFDAVCRQQLLNLSFTW